MKPTNIHQNFLASDPMSGHHLPGSVVWLEMEPFLEELRGVDTF